MMPIPYAFNLLGWSLGSAMLVGVALISYWTMAVMVQVSAETERGTVTGRLLRHNVRFVGAASQALTAALLP
jgi:amino acid permease